MQQVPSDEATDEDGGSKQPIRRKAFKLVNSLSFSIIITVAILLNLVQLFVEEAFRTDENDSMEILLVMEVVFNSIFLIECILKITALRKKYFLAGGNLFDLLLVVLGILGICAEIFDTESGVFSSDSRVLRMNRVFRAMRILRVFRLIKFIRTLRAKLLRENVSQDLAIDLRRIIILMAFVRAQSEAQHELLELFGSLEDHEAPANAAQARCLLESQSHVYRALTIAAERAQTLGDFVLPRMNVLKEGIHIVDDLNHIVMAAHNTGVLNAREADGLMKPLQSYSKLWADHIKRSEMGISAIRQKDTSRMKTVLSILEAAPSGQNPGPIREADENEFDDERQIKECESLQSLPMPTTTKKGNHESPRHTLESARHTAGPEPGQSSPLAPLPGQTTPDGLHESPPIPGAEADEAGAASSSHQGSGTTKSAW
jgi:hypothetical protein